MKPEARTKSASASCVDCPVYVSLIWVRLARGRGGASYARWNFRRSSLYRRVRSPFTAASGENHYGLIRLSGAFRWRDFHWGKWSEISRAPRPASERRPHSRRPIDIKEFPFTPLTSSSKLETSSFRQYSRRNSGAGLWTAAPFERGSEARFCSLSGADPGPIGL